MAESTFAGVLISTLVKKYGSPLYVYDAAVIRKQYHTLFNALTWQKKQLLYAAKANTNMALLKLLCNEGAWLDVVSPFELEIGLQAGFKPQQILYTVSSITDEEIRFVMSKKVLLNIDSLSGLERFGTLFPGKNVCLRFMPGVKAGGHKYLMTGHKETKFGIAFDELSAVNNIVNRYNLKIIGLHEHTGTYIKNINLFLKSAKNILDCAHHFPNLEFIDFGSGFPIPYKPDEKEFAVDVFGRAISSLFSDFCKKYGRNLFMYFEPGRYIVAQAGTLLSTVTVMKQRGTTMYVILDTGFNHLVRSTMYGSYHEIVNGSSSRKKKKYTVVGNICESGDIFGKDRMLSEVREGDILAIKDAGAYGFSMASNYNSRPLPAEVMIDKGKVTLIRRRQKVEDLLREQLV
ncbi:diaminopimelate decarboxylase [Candidatus Woesearchaeota archaeon]|nr:diaminopimelate decarboxylase [Candidatus Woesearchaeota archaeon]